MKHLLLAALTCCAIAGLAPGASSPPKKAVAPSRKAAPAQAQKVVSKKGVVTTGPSPASKTASRSTAGHTTPTGSKTGSAYHASSGSHNAYRGRYTNYRRQPARHYSAQQMAPTPDRYREIQDALATQGYLKSPPTGVWDKDSIDAMQRFQKDKNLDPTGKLTARSLSLLGLGPSSTGTPAAAAANPTARLSADPTNEAVPLQQ